MTSPHPVLAPLEQPPEPGGRSGRFKEGLLIGLATLLGAAVVLGGLVAVQRWRNGGDEVATADAGDAAGDEDDEGSAAGAAQDETGPTTTEDAAPSTTEVEEADDEQPEDSAPAVASVPCPDQYTAEICDAADFVQQTRGRPFKEFPNIELLDDAEFDLALVEDLDESEQDLRDAEALLKSLGLIPLDIDLFQSFEALIESGVVGFYDPEDGRLVVRGGEFDLYGQAILVHELVHAFDDQWFDLSRDDFENDDAEYGYSAVIEGNASRVEQLWRDRLSPQDQALLTEQEFSSLSPEDLENLLSLPRIVLDLQLSPYEDGEAYVNELVDAGGEQGVDDRFVNPPESSEEVLHPGDAPDSLVIVDVETPPSDGSVILEDRLGELVVRLWLGPQAGDGWGGDRYVVYESAGQTCTVVDIAADSDADLSEIETAAGAWAERQADQRQVEIIDGADRSLVRITGCFG